MAQLEKIDALTDIQSSLAEGYPEVQIDYDRTLRPFWPDNQPGREPSPRDKVLGTTATTISGGDGRIDLTVRLDPEQRRGVTNIERLNINPQLVATDPTVECGNVFSIDWSQRDSSSGPAKSGGHFRQYGRLRPIGCGRPQSSMNWMVCNSKATGRLGAKTERCSAHSTACKWP